MIERKAKMKEELEVDFNLLKSQKLYLIFIIVLVLSVYIGWGSPLQGMVICSVAAAACSLVPITYNFDKISSSKYNKSLSKKTYILEKFLLSFICIVVMSVLCGSLMSFLYYDSTISNLSLWITNILICIVMSMLLSSASILIHLIIDVKKARVMTFVMAFIIFTIIDDSVLNNISKTIVDLLGIGTVMIARWLMIFAIIFVIITLLLVSIKAVKKLSIK